ncbi:DEAD/DEAH box helicase [Lapidilactobacillus achengensis]|uniref:DEAD-box ATP-dependent RNA helicase CshA n=1 Tax=Lapidilactobacillus achengensis TaxID=2486000 RepID=A0ABW1UU75_9LACO|nr:DEAD/DEAH box helicase [Lapidilactobacillus achengensis]
MKFSELNLEPDLLEAVERAGFTEATPIQAETIPLVLAGDDVLGQAQTGTGKTAAFGLPSLQHVDMDDPQIQTLIISPTRELAIQTQEEMQRLGAAKHVKVQVVYGGSDISRQIRNLKKKPQILVGTPGRLLDHINRHTVKLDGIKTIILDEADEMLDMGFVEDIESILSHVPNQHQTLLFSATMPKQIMGIAERFMHDPKIIKIKSKELTADLIDQYYIRSKEFERFDMMTRLFDVQNPKLALIFGRTKRRVDELTKGLQARGYKAEGIHGDLTQQKRMSVLREFKSGELQFLVATDVAARGLDISGVTHVYNYDIPQDPDGYVHRIGRTGRAGAAGVSVTFVAGSEMGYLHAIEDLTRVRMTPLKPATAKEAFRGQLHAAYAEVDQLIDNADLERFAGPAQELLEKYTPEQLAAALLRSQVKDPSQVPVHIAPERPLPSRKVSKPHYGNKRGGGSRSSYNRRGDRSHGDRDRSRGERGGDSRGRRSGSGNGGSRHQGGNNGGKRNFTIRKNPTA